MDGQITGETDELVGVSIIDNNGVEHVIDVNKENGEFKGHSQDSYADKGRNRTNEESEHIKQARRYARYYVHEERGYDTIAPREHPEWLAVVASVIAQQPREEFESQFHDYYQQLRSHVDDDLAPVIELPESEIAGLRSYRLNVHLNIELDAVLGAHEAASLTETISETEDVETMATEIYEALAGVVVEPTALDVAGVSELGALYQGPTEDVEIETEDPHPGPADARLEISPTKASSLDSDYLPIEGFQLLVVHHLLCQARDYYLGMGLEPPESLRVLGLGTYRQTVRNEHLNMYDPVHSTTEPVEGYSLPGFGTHLNDNPT